MAAYFSSRDISEWVGEVAASAWTSASMRPEMVPRTRPSRWTRPAALVVWISAGYLMLNAVFSMMTSPSSKISGSTHITRNMEIMVPRPMHRPTP